MFLLQLKSGPHPASLIALQQISQLVLPGSSGAASKLAGASSKSIELNAAGRPRR